MTQAEVENLLKALAKTQEDLEETSRLVRAAVTRVIIITARLHLHGDQEDATNLQKLIQADIEGLREARRKPAVRTHGELTEDVARLEKLLLELQTDIRALRDRLNPNEGQA